MRVSTRSSAPSCEACTATRPLERAGRSIALVGDLAVGADPGGADNWMWQDLFARGMDVGAPPDEFNTLGQNWGLMPFDPGRG